MLLDQWMIWAYLCRTNTLFAAALASSVSSTSDADMQILMVHSDVIESTYGAYNLNIGLKCLAISRSCTHCFSTLVENPALHCDPLQHSSYHDAVRP